MKKVLNVLFCCILVLCIGAVACAQQGAPLRTIQDAECMMFHGKDLFAYTSGELYALQQALGLSNAESIGYIGYGKDTPEREFPGFSLTFEGCFVTTQSDSPQSSAESEALTSLPLEQTPYPVRYVDVQESGVPGPFGIEVGMPVEAVLNVLPELMTKSGASKEANQPYTLSMRYQSNAGGEPEVFLLIVSCSDGKVTSYSVHHEQP